MNYTKKYSIQREVDTDDGNGGFTRGWIEISISWGAFSLSQRSFGSSEVIIGKQGQTKIDYIFYTPTSIDIKKGDRIINGATTLSVIDVGQPEGGSDLQCRCQEVQK